MPHSREFLSHSPALVQFGLDRTEEIDGLKIRWPSGQVQKFRNLEENRHLRLTEGSDAVEVIYPPPP